MKITRVLTGISFCCVLFTACDRTHPKTRTDIPFFLPDDLEVTLWAESPMFHNPTNIDIDARGRLWVTEAVNYRNFNNDSTRFLHYPQGDRVVILEDTDHDGVADTSKVYVQDTSLVSPLGIAVIGNKVIVSCAPNLIIYTDEDGDDKPDKKEIFLTGFGGKDHDHALHAVLAGADGNWYFNTGNAGPHLVTDKAGWSLRSGSIYNGGTPYSKGNEGNLKSDDGKVWVGGLALRIRPDGTGLKVMGHNFRNAYELTVDSYGNFWQNDNDDEVAACRVSWLAEGANAGYFSADGTRTWAADQRPDQDVFTAHWHQEDPGVMPVGDRSGAGAPTGIVLNEGDALGEKYRGMLLSADAGRNVVFGYYPEKEKSGLVPGKRFNFFTSLSEDNALYVWNDSAANANKEKWFRPSDVAIGTDGALYIADWYDPVVGGHQMQDKKGVGRIYRVTPKNKTLVAPAIDLSTTTGQIAALRNPAVNVRYLGFLQLKQQGEAVLDPVQDLLKDKNPYIQARAIWLLPQLGDKGIEATAALLKNKDEMIRATAFRSLRAVVPDILPYAVQLQNDPSAFVRREIAIALRDLPFDKIQPVLLELSRQFDGEDLWYLNALGDAMEGHEEEMYPRVKQLLAENKTAAEWDKKMSRFAWRLHPESALNDLLQRAADPALEAGERKRAITAIGFMKSREAAEAMLALRENRLPDVAEQASYWLSFRQGNNWYALLDWGKLKINTGYEKKLNAAKAKLMVVQDGRLSLGTRQGRLKQLVLDSIGGQLLIGLASENKFPPELVPAVEENIFKNPDLTIRVQAGKYFKQPGTPKNYSIADMAALKGDPQNGKAVFTAHCASCHKFAQTGAAIGPELTRIGKKFDKMGLFDAIVNPSAAILLGYEPWLINTKDGSSFFGFLISENKQTVIIKDIAGQQHTISTDQISTRQKQDKSLMPEPGLAGISEQELADVVSFLLAG
ncbi:MAG: c-type cytochrome [Chitinophagaceae bacterium]|nr:c-type cytochrome [Chitinophagaceae bacterium]